MHVTIAPNGYLQIDNARITHKNFEGRAEKFNAAGKRNFSLIIPDEETRDLLLNDRNEAGMGWNVKTRPPKDEDSDPFMFLKVNVKFNDRGPNVYLVTGNRQNELNQDTVKIIDDIAIDHVDLDIRPYDDEINGKPFRSAYLAGIRVFQKPPQNRFLVEDDEFDEE